MDQGRKQEDKVKTDLPSPEREGEEKGRRGKERGAHGHKSTGQREEEREL